MSHVEVYFQVAEAGGRSLKTLASLKRCPNSGLNKL